jgi:hypothetical protein
MLRDLRDTDAGADETPDRPCADQTYRSLTVDIRGFAKDWIDSRTTQALQELLSRYRVISERPRAAISEGKKSEEPDKVSLGYSMG